MDLLFKATTIHCCAGVCGIGINLISLLMTKSLRNNVQHL